MSSPQISSGRARHPARSARDPHGRVVRGNGTGLQKNGVVSTVQSTTNGQVNLVLTPEEGKMLRAGASGGTLTGTGDSDTIRGTGGRDVVVYDRTAWAETPLQRQTEP